MPTLFRVKERTGTMQKKKNIQNLLFPSSCASSQGLYLLWEVPMGTGRIGFENAQLISSKGRDFKKELNPLLEDPHGAAGQLNQFLSPQVYIWTELMSILGILFTGKRQG
jgi:hypothetical protein